MEFDGDFKINKTTEASLIILITLFFLLMGSMIAWVNYHSKSGREMLLDESLQLSFKGRVDSTFREKMNHNVECATLSGGDTFKLWPEWEPIVEVGDSVVKEPNRSFAVLYKKSGKRMILDYKKVIGNIK